MLDPKYSLCSYGNMVYQIKHFPIWLCGLNNLMVLASFVTLLYVQICVQICVLK